MSQSNGKWRSASVAHPCPICGDVKRCSVSEDGGVINCYRESYSSEYGDCQKKKSGKLGDYHVFFTRPRAAKNPPPIHSHSEGAEKPATPEERDRAYRAFLDLLTRDGVGEELDRRGVPDRSPLHKWYRALPLKGRAAIARKLVEAGHEALMARTPGFYVATGDRGGKFWTFGGQPGLVIPLLGHTGLITALCLRPSADDGSGKYKFFAAPKKAGPAAKNTRSAHFPVWSGTTDVIRLTEGVLKADIATELGGVFTVGMPGLTVRGLATALKKRGVKTVRLCLDGDASRNRHVAAAVQQHFRRLKRAGFVVELERWSEEDGKGIDDLLANGKEPELLTGDAVAEAVQQMTRAAAERNRGGRQFIEVTPHEAEVQRQVVDALAQNDAGLYERSGQLVTIIIPTGPKPVPPIIHTLTSAAIRSRITDACQLVQMKQTQDGAAVAEVNPPDWLAPAVRDAGAWSGVRSLVGVTTSPVLRPDGTVHQSPGYDCVTALFYAPNATFPEVPEAPTREDAVAALERLKAGVDEFPWQEPCDLSAWLAEVLTVCCRTAFDGAAPGFYHTANVAGAGKTAPVNATALIATGLEAPFEGYPCIGNRGEQTEHNEELRKLATTCAMEGHPLYMLDNVPTGHVFGSAALDAIITSTTNSGRELGTNSAPRREMRTVWILTGNNIAPRGDSTRRFVAVRLYSSEEKPEEREFTGPDVLVWAKRYRPELFVAALTAVAAYIRAGKPPVGIKPMGSFQSWSDTIRSALIWAGEPDPCSARATVVSEDPERANAHCLMRLLVACGADGEPMTAQQLVDKVKDEMSKCRPIGTPESSWVLTAVPSEKPRCDFYRTVFPTARFPESTKLGLALRKHKGRVIDGLRIEQKGVTRDKVALWTVAEVRGMDPDAGDDF